MGKRVEVVITYLEQRARPSRPTPARPSMPVAILRAERPPLHFYRYLYNAVGEPHNWVSRRALSDAALAEIIHDPRVYLYVLYATGAPAGMAELDMREAGAADLKFFGLAPEYQSHGLGRYFLSQVIDLAWSMGPERIKLETCSLDHPAALPLYQKMGFTVFDQRKGEVELIDGEAKRQDL